MCRTQTVVPVVLTLLFSVAATTQPSAGPIEGVVTTMDGKPIAGAEVMMLRQQYSREGNFRFQGVEVLSQTTSDAEGVFHLPLPARPTDDSHAGALFIRATAPSYAYGFVDCEPGEGSVKYFDFLRQQSVTRPAIILPPEAKITGDVVDEQGKSVAGAQINAHSVGDPVRTDSQGRFTIEKARPSAFGSFHDTARLSVHHDDYVDITATVTPVEVGKENATKITLQHGVLLSGTVTEDRTGKPLKDQTLMVRSNDPMSEHWWSATSDANGHYEMRIPVGEQDVHTFSERGEGTDETNFYPVVSHRTVRPAAGEEKVTADFAFRRGSIITGKINIPPALSADTFFIEARPAGSPDRGGAERFRATIQKDGAFRVQQLRPGKYDLILFQIGDGHVRGELARQTVTLKQDETASGVSFDLPAAVAAALTNPVRGVVRMPDGKPAVNAKLNLIASDERGMEDQAGSFGFDTHSDADGSFAYRSIDPGRKWTLWVKDATGTTSAALELNDAAALAKSIEVTLEPGVQVSGKVVDAGGKPIPEYEVVLSEVVEHDRMWSHRPLYYTKTDAQGDYVLKAIVVPAGRANLELEARPSFEKSRNTKKSQQSEGYKNLSLKPDAPLSGLDFRVEETDSSVRVSPAKDTH